ncbi:related to SKN7 [Cephalotrichum gorgonifer]|uniref:Related to SKN7 n=1 Tax=Cephalotrichum gorgonifer TaxID=2041049 RepID=A0AAE8N2Q9_9PEZI|nr:related to SKN7 [Cephalotrichum gorgonifer]
MSADKASPAQGGNTSSDFVRKLYRMLEEPEYADIVRWGRDGQSFVVLEGEKFSTQILPKHFKHGNFASFVRQLNKYDFHKIRRPEDNSQGYGPNAWEFKHPGFRIDAKDGLDLIRRKAPSSSKRAQQQQQQQQQKRQHQPPPEQVQGGHNTPSEQQFQSLTDSLNALQKKVEELANTNKQLVGEIVELQKTTGVQRQAQYELLHYLENSPRRGPQAAASSPAGPVASRTQGDELPAELRRARELLVSVGPPPVATSVERSHHPMYPSPAESSEAAAVFVSPDLNAGIAVMDGTVAMPRLNVYSANQPAGMEAFHPDQIQNLSYSVPRNRSLEGAASPGTDKSEDDWRPRKPHIFLVEDDNICAKIGTKFLKSLGCAVTLAKDGLEAVKMFDSKPAPLFDLIFMDIIMPHLDGVRATARIRNWLPQAPIVAMTSNIRQDEVAIYFQYGMTDVLAKPFTREGMQRMLRKYLSHLLANRTPPAPASTGGPYAGVQAGTGLSVGDISALDTSLGGGHMSMKFEGTPIASPSAGQGGVWGSPGTMTSHSPSASPLQMGGGVGVGVNGGAQLVMASPQTGGYHGFMAPSMVGERPEKRQRVVGL